MGKRTWQRHLPASLCHRLGRPLSDENMTSVFWKSRMFGDESEVFRIERMKSAERDVLEAVEVIVTRRRGKLEGKISEFWENLQLIISGPMENLSTLYSSTCLMKLALSELT